MKSWRFTMTKNWIPGPLVSDFWKLAFFGGVVRSVSTGLKSINLEHMKMPANWHIARFRLRGKTLGWVFFRVQGGGWFGWCAFLGTNEGPTRFVGCCWLGCVACETKQISDSSCWCFFSPRFPQTQIDSSNAFSKRCSLFEAVGWLVGTVQISLGCLAATSRSQPTAWQRFMSSFWGCDSSPTQPPTANPQDFLQFCHVGVLPEGGASQCIIWHKSRPKWCRNDTVGM